MKQAALFRRGDSRMLAAVGVLIMALQVSIHAVDLDPSLKLHLDFDGDFSGGQVIDMSGNGNHGWGYNPTNWISVTSGVFGSAAAQFTINNYMTDGTANGQIGTNTSWITNPPPGVHIYPASQYLGITNLNGIYQLTNATISYWAQFDGGNGNWPIHLLDCSRNVNYAYAPSEASNSWVIARQAFTYQTEFSVCPATGGYRSVVSWPSQGLVNTNFNLYTLTVDCLNNQAVAFYNGNPYKTNSINLPWIRIYGGPKLFTKHWLCVGAMSYDGTPEWGDDRYPNSGYMSGKMDDIRIYNRTLSASEIQALYYGAGTPANSRFVSLQQPDAETMKLSWYSQSNVLYQVEYLTNFAVGSWKALFAPIMGSGGTNTITNSMMGQPMKYYRVRPLP